MMRFKERMRMLRESNNLTQDALSSLIDVPAASLSRYEAGKSVPNAIVIYKYCCYFKVSADYFLGISDNRKTVDDFVKDSEEITLKVKTFDSLRYYMERYEEEVAICKGDNGSRKMKVEKE